LAKATDATAEFSSTEIALIEPLSRAVAPVSPADRGKVRKAITAVVAALPAQATDEFTGRLKLTTYYKMLEGCDEAALAYACRRCLDELDWFPTIHQLKERMARYVSPEQHQINVARYIVRNGRRKAAEEVCEPWTDEEIRRMSPELRRMGLKLGAITQAQIDKVTAEQAAEAVEQRAA